jgi:hypothetical protein
VAFIFVSAGNVGKDSDIVVPVVGDQVMKKVVEKQRKNTEKQKKGKILVKKQKNNVARTYSQSKRRKVRALRKKNNPATMPLLLSVK